MPLVQLLLCGSWTIRGSPPKDNAVRVLLCPYSFASRVFKLSFDQSLFDPPSKVAGLADSKAVFFVYVTGFVNSRLIGRGHTRRVISRVQLELVPGNPITPM